MSCRLEKSTWKDLERQEDLENILHESIGIYYFILFTLLHIETGTA